MEHQKSHDANRDPITGAPGSHPVGTGVGAASGGIAAGAAVGTVAGPVGTAIGAAVGAVVGGLAGKAVAERIDPTVVDDHWRDRYDSEPYHEAGMQYDDYSPAYQLGAESRSRYADNKFDDIEDDLELEYNDRRGNSKLEWEQARHAARASYDTDYRRQ